MKIPGYSSTPEIMARFKWANANSLAQVARARGWKPVKFGGNVNYWPDEFIEEYAADRQRTELLRKTGWLNGMGAQLVRDDSYDSTCPTCGAYAVEKPPESGVEAGQPAPWLCENGHSSE